MRGLFLAHARSKRRDQLRSHFSALEVWDNVRDAEVAGLEGLFRHIYRNSAVLLPAFPTRLLSPRS